MENRKFARFQIMVPVSIITNDYGIFDAVAVNISRGGVFIQTFDPLPLGTMVVVEFGIEEILRVSGVVRSHYYMTYRSNPTDGTCTGMGIVFHDFLENESLPEGKELQYQTH